LFLIYLFFVLFLQRRAVVVVNGGGNDGDGDVVVVVVKLTVNYEKVLLTAFFRFLSLIFLSLFDYRFSSISSE